MKVDRKSIFDKYWGRCAYCGIELGSKWHIDHIEPVVRGLKDGKPLKPENENPDNLNPACASCNIQKNSYTLEGFRKNIQHFIYSLNNYSTQYKFAKRYGLVNETGGEVVFYFETIKA